MTHPNITKTLELSTANISYPTSLWIAQQLENEECQPGFTSALTIYDKTRRSQCEDENYGWWIAVTPDPTYKDPADWARIPLDLKVVINFARLHECTWLMFDRDCDIVNELPVFEW